jgi:cytochrome b involved in lipid metabolism
MCTGKPTMVGAAPHKTGEGSHESSGKDALVVINLHDEVKEEESKEAGTPPSARDAMSDASCLFPMHERWLQEKAERDQARKGFSDTMWCVHGDFYDLSEFMKTHPGGREYIELTRGQDITEVSRPNAP